MKDTFRKIDLPKIKQISVHLHWGYLLFLSYYGDIIEIKYRSLTVKKIKMLHIKFIHYSICCKIFVENFNNELFKINIDSGGGMEIYPINKNFMKCDILQILSVSNNDIFILGSNYKIYRISGFSYQNFEILQKIDGIIQIGENINFEFNIYAMDANGIIYLITEDTLHNPNKIYENKCITGILSYIQKIYPKSSKLNLTYT